MKRLPRLVLTTLLAVIFLPLSFTPASADQTISGYVKVSEKRITLTVFEYVYRATLTNTGPALAGATAFAFADSTATTIIDGSLSFGPIGAGGSALSTDTFTFRQDRSQPFSFSNIQWVISPTAGNQPPVANAGPDQPIAGIGVSVQLDGTGSSDPEGAALTYQWTFSQRPSGSAAVLSAATAAKPTFVPDRKGTYTVQLIVSDGVLSSAADTVTITVANTPPLASAGPDQTVAPGSIVTLSGAASSDANGDPLTYSWAFTARPAGSGAALQNPTSVNPTFVIDVPGTYTVRLIVNDGTSSSAPDTVVISTDNSAPVANAGTDRTAVVGQSVMLDGSASSDVDGDPLTFSWAFVSRPAGSAATLSSPSAVKPTFTVDTPGTYQVRLIVNDGKVSSAPDVVVITTRNSPPTADAGPNQTVAAGTTVTLNGSGSTDIDGDPLTYSWSLTTKPAGSTATLSNPTTVMPTFVADRAGTYIAQLVVNDGSVSSNPDTVTITTENTAPIADAGSDQSVVAGQTVFLSGAGSSDPNGDPLTFQWSFVSRSGGSAATLSNPTSLGPSFTADRPGTYVVQLVVNDGTVNSAPDTVTITTTNSTPVANAGADQLGVPVSSVVTLNGLASTDADSHPLTYRWSLLSKPSGSAAALNNTAIASPTFTVDLPGDYVAQLIVNDGFVDSAPDTVLIRVVQAALPEVTIDATDASASEPGTDTGTLTITRTGPTTNALTVFYAISGGAVNGTDYQTLATSVVIPAGSASATITVTPLPDALAESDEAVTLTISANANYTIGTSAAGTVTIHDAAPTPVVTVVATDASASEIGPDTGTFRFTRTGPTTAALTVLYGVGGTATNTTDYVAISGTIVIPIGQSFADLTITPAADGSPEGAETVTVTVTDAAAYNPGSPASATVTIADSSPTVTVIASDSSASENGPDTGTFTFSRTGSTTAALTVNFAVAGTASQGVDYPILGTSVTIPIGQTSAQLVVTPTQDGVIEGNESIIVTLASGAYLIGSPAAATVVIGDCENAGGTLLNGAMHCGTIGAAGETDTWTFTATAGDRMTVHIGEIVDNNDFRPRIRLVSPSSVTLADSSGTDATVIDDIVAAATGTYTVLVSSFDSGFDGTGAYRISMAHTPGPITVSAGDQGGPLTNGAMHTGEILQGDVDVWTFTANQGERIALHIGEMIDSDDFRPWLRLWAPNGASLGDTAGVAANVIDDVVAPVTGTYLVLVASFDSGFDGTGTYRLTMTKTPGPITVSTGDQGGPLTNGAIQTGEIIKGDVDVWTFTATAGERIALHIGEIVDSDDFRPWIRLWAPNGASLGDTAGVAADVIDDVVAPVTGTYLVLVASFDSGFDGTGTYRLTMTKTPGPITVSTGDQGGPLTNGAIQTGEIIKGDVDVWTFTATAGERLAVHIGEIIDNDDFRPWIRVWAPNGASLGDTAGVAADVIDDVVAPVTGTYLVLVASFDSGFDGTGTYRLTLTKTPGPITVSTDDQGGPLTNGATHTGEIIRGDVDVWTFTANAGERIALHIGEITDNDDFRPWIRLWAPNGASLGDSAGVAADVIDDVVAPVTGTYLVLVASFDSGFDGTGTYRLTMTHTPGPITVSTGDDGGPLTNGATHTGTIVRGDVDVWTFTASVGERISVHIGEITDNDDFRPWIRIWAPNGASLGDTAGIAADVIDDVVAPVAGTYLVLVASFDSGFDGTGTYQLTMAKTSGAVTVSAGDEGGPLTSGVTQSGTIAVGDVDVWTFTAVAGQPIHVQIAEVTDVSGFSPWIRLWTPNGTSLGDTAGLTSAAINVTSAPVTGTYLILVASFDSGFDATGTYNLTATH